ncbi:MAG: peptidylprolyl isomerase [Candidatus Heimdallarchaeota archaeon]|nr:peptidylprolyl isomerase [Candidatus Heimdallarchaeota archaeon]
MSKTTGIMTTSKGKIHFELSDETINTTKNFVTLAQNKFYDGLNFHRVIPEFVIQGGCPEGSGRGGPGYSINCETSAKQRHESGAFSMAHAGPNTGGSQFFIVLTREQTSHLDGKHTVFGKTTEGLDVVQKIQAKDKIEKIEITSISDKVNNHILVKGNRR